jgi:mono/diheme cytochrome c family protein
MKPLFLAGIHLAVTIAVAYVLRAETTTPKAAAVQHAVAITPVSGESWLLHLHRSFDETSMGKTGHLGPGPQDISVMPLPPQNLDYSFRQRGTLTGADLYRLNCQGCHGKSGFGAPPEINSVINPVRAASVPLVLARMKSNGMEISYSEAVKLAEQSRLALVNRLHNGGENMPPFSHLSEPEIRALMAYLNKLAEVPSAAKEQSVVSESPLRVGELIVKSTCHTCHSAVGVNPGPGAVMDGAIPPLSALPTRVSQSEFVRKVTQGAPVLMGMPPALFRGRMPVFYYLNEEEAIDVYAYLMLYPPSDRAPQSPLMAASMSVSPQDGPGHGSPGSTLPSRDTAASDLESSSAARFELIGLPILVVFVTGLLAGGLYFTFREFKRLSANSNNSAAPVLDVSTGKGMTAHLGAADSLQPLLCENTDRMSEYRMSE